MSKRQATNKSANLERVQAENYELRRRLEEVEDTIRAIREGAVDAFVVEQPEGSRRIYTLEGADRPYRILVEQMQQGAATLQDDGRIAYCNKRLADLLQIPLEKLIGAALVSFIAEDDHSILETLLREGRSGSGSGEAHLRRTDGALVPAYLTFNALPRDCGVAMGALFTDLTEQRLHEKLTEAHDALLKSEERYRSLTKVLTSIVWTMDGTGSFVTPQSEWESFTGQMWDEYKGKGWVNAIHPADRELVRICWRRALDNHSIYESEGLLWHAKTGEYHHCVARAVPLFNPDGSVREWIGNILDVHEQKKVEIEREKLLVTEREAREAATSASLSKDEFLATVSHELRTPLNAMLGWTRLLSTGELDEQTKQRGLKVIEQASRAQAQLIEDLLDVSRIISGKFRLALEPIEPMRVIDGAVESVRPAAEAKGVSLQLTFAPDVGLVSGDPGRLQQVIWNLLSNAVKFTPPGGRVEVKLSRVGSLIEIVVSDTGQGIEPKFLPYVFERFRQADGSTTRSYGGLGLGLAIVRHITELHGGTVTADSAGKDQGSTFTVRLPVLTTPAKQIEQVRRVFKPDAGGELGFKPKSSLEGLNVLVVDDEQDTLDLTRTVLSLCGARVKTASSAEEAFRDLEDWGPNVIVSDIGMPGQDGYSFLRRVKAWAREAGTWIPAVALTGYARSEDRMKALASGFEIYISKPVEPAKLISAIEGLAERVRAHSKGTPG
jgi:PAS domain S-box-containing protein